MLPSVETYRWYRARLSAMSMRELGHRLREHLRKRRYRNAPPTVVALNAEPREVFLDLVRQLTEKQTLAKWCRERSTALSCGQLEIFGADWPLDASGCPDWVFDPSGQPWPLDYCFSINYRRASDGRADVKYVWEANRLTYLLPVAACALLDNDRKLAELCATHIRSWIAANPPYNGVGWASGIECAMRVLSLVVVDELLGDMIDDRFSDEVRSTVATQIDWISRFPSLYSSANNHRLAELAAQLIGGARYPGLLSPKTTTQVADELRREGLRQFHTDGVSGEQATGYAAFALEWLAIGRHALRASGLASTPEFDKRLVRALEVLEALTDNQGRMVRFGDDDQSRLLSSLVAEHEIVSLLRFLILDSWPGEGWTTQGLRTWTKGGWSVARSGIGKREALLVFEHGPLGLGDLAAHAHADTLAVYLHVGGEPLIVDAGTYLYHAAGPWRDVLRSTAVHNTLSIGGRNSSSMAGPFNWSRTHRATGRLLATDHCGDDWRLEAEHDGYVAQFQSLHRRRVAKEGTSRYRITDALTSPEPRAVTASLLVAPDVDVSAFPHGWALSRHGKLVAEITVTEGWQTRQYRGSEEPRLGWYSPVFGCLVPTWQLVTSGTLRLGDELETSIQLPQDS